MQAMTSVIKLAKKPDGQYPRNDDIFKLEQVKMPTADDLSKDQVLIQLMHISIDAAMRVWISGVKTYIDAVLPGHKMPCQGLAKVLYSKNNKFQQGDLVLGLMVWQEIQIVKGKNLQKLPMQLKDNRDFLGLFGVSALTAYFGFFNVGKPKKDEVVVVSAAFGAVGQVVVQLAKDFGCKVIALAGSDEKCAYLKDILNADLTINYKTTKSIYQEVKNFAPKGIDIYFDNVGGEILDTICKIVNLKARIILCGAISTYNSQENYGLKNYSNLILKRGIMQGFIVLDYAKEYITAIQKLFQLKEQGKMKFLYHEYIGLDKAPLALSNLLQGKNKGKSIVTINNQKL